MLKADRMAAASVHGSRDLDLTEGIEGMKKRQTQRHIASWDGLWALRWGNCSTIDTGCLYCVELSRRRN